MLEQFFPNEDTIESLYYVYMYNRKSFFSVQYLLFLCYIYIVNMYKSDISTFYQRKKRSNAKIMDCTNHF